MLRFRPHVSNVIFNSTFEQGFLYLLVLVINIVIVGYLVFIRKKNSNIIITFISKWIHLSYEKLMDYIENLAYPANEILPLITTYYLRIPMNILILLEYLPRAFLTLTISFDVFWFEKFQYTYYMIYLLFFTLIAKVILFISIALNERLLLEISTSLNIANFERNLTEAQKDNPHFNPQDITLSKNNKYFQNVQHCLQVSSLTNNELEKLYNIKEKLANPLWFIVMSRVFYIIIFGYLCYCYPLSIIGIIVQFIYYKLIPLIFINIVMVVSGFLFYLLYYRNKL